MKKDTTYHVHICIPSYLKKPDSYFKDMIIRDGKTLEPSEAREFLASELEAGRTCFCGCDNTRPDGSCAGHEIDDK